jgi:hypothetical protein
MTMTMTLTPRTTLRGIGWTYDASCAPDPEVLVTTDESLKFRPAGDQMEPSTSTSSRASVLPERTRLDSSRRQKPATRR